jgi:hypothetical protein
MKMHPLDRKMAILHRRARRLSVAYGLCLSIASLVALAIVWGWADYCIRLQDRGLRVLASLAMVGVWVWITFRFTRRSLAARFKDIELALHVESHFPALKDRLGSAVQFLQTKEDDPEAGSAAMRCAVIEQTTKTAEPLDFLAVLNARPTIRAGTALAAVLLIAAIAGTLHPAAVKIAVLRLGNPFCDAAWPRSYYLTLREPVSRVARGKAFQIEVLDANGCQLPSNVRIYYRFVGPDGAVVEETERLREADGAMVARRENVLRPFSYRVEGGDDRTMPWRDVTVVEPPKIATMTIRLNPPAYTGWPSTASERHIRAMIGTRVEITAKATRPLRSAVLRVDERTRIPATIGRDGQALQAEFNVEKSGTYGFDLVDRDGLRGGDDRWEVHAIEDASPKVVMEQPTANLSVTSQATIPLRIVAKDDLAIVRVAIQFRNADGGTESTLLLWEANGSPSAKTPADVEAKQGDTRVVEYRWDLASLAWKPGMQATFFATASDSRGQTAKSESRVLNVITGEELQERLVTREKLIVSELQRAMKSEQNCRSQVETLQRRFDERQPLGQAEVDQLQAIGHSQRDVDLLLTSGAEGVPMHLRTLAMDLEMNHVANDEMQGRIAAVASDLERMRREHLPTIERMLTTAAKSAQTQWESKKQESKADTNIGASLGEAAKQQQEVVRALGKQIAQWTRWDNYRRFGREMLQLAREHDGVTRRTTEVGRRTLTLALQDLTPQDIADLRSPAQKESEIARRLDRLLQEMEQAGPELQENNPTAAKKVADALGLARGKGISGEMWSVGEEIKKNQIGRAVVGLKEINSGLKAVAAILNAGGAEESGDRATKPSKAGDQAKPGEAKTPGEEKSNETASPKPGESGKPATGKEGDAAGRAPTDGEGKKQPTQAEEVQATMKQLWGELPEQARERMLQSPVEQFPPKYETMIEDYYRRLAEEKK